jgi:hypothetical protein
MTPARAREAAQTTNTEIERVPSGSIGFSGGWPLGSLHSASVILPFPAQASHFTG